MSAFQIEQFTRIRDDPCNQDVQDRERQGVNSYRMTSLLPASSDAQEIAYQQSILTPSIGGYGWSSAQINADSLLRNHALQTNSPHAPIRGRVQARPFLTVPYMGRGRVDAGVESQLQQPMGVREAKSCATVSDAFYENQFIPQIPHLQANIQNPAHIIQEEASAGWVRSGIPSRLWLRDQNEGQYNGR